MQYNKFHCLAQQSACSRTTTLSSVAGRNPCCHDTATVVGTATVADAIDTLSIELPQNEMNTELVAGFNAESSHIT